MVTLGSTITLSPVGRVLTRNLVAVYCSAMRGETLDLIPPVLYKQLVKPSQMLITVPYPSPRITMETINPPRPAPLSREPGREVVKMTTKPQR